MKGKNGYKYYKHAFFEHLLEKQIKVLFFLLSTATNISTFVDCVDSVEAVWLVLLSWPHSSVSPSKLQWMLARLVLELPHYRTGRSTAETVTFVVSDTLEELFNYSTCHVWIFNLHMFSCRFSGQSCSVMLMLPPHHLTLCLYFNYLDFGRSPCLQFVWSSPLSLG